ncbi:Agenet domain containing protein [Quillaja saponaria]|uniref:Agenet domain containing protein n=1 Tax=Quillaja saponaria TaxID=32244 RepID=A0AAD7VMT2_QUISA|nr:Agenet domain containing protein [Quillaja saponaria]
MRSPLPLKKMEFERGDKVEVCSQEDGFLGSYYEARIISNLRNKRGLYVVQYKNLLEDDESGPLIETVYSKEIRPLPPNITNNTDGFSLFDWVDAFDNDGWWVGRITERKPDSDYYTVYFAYFGVEIAYPVSTLRIHQEWFKGKWVKAKF